MQGTFDTDSADALSCGRFSSYKQQNALPFMPPHYLPPLLNSRLNHVCLPLLLLVSPTAVCYCGNARYRLCIRRANQLDAVRAAESRLCASLFSGSSLRPNFTVTNRSMRACPCLHNHPLFAAQTSCICSNRYITTMKERHKFSRAVSITTAGMAVVYVCVAVTGYTCFGNAIDVHQ